MQRNHTDFHINSNMQTTSTIAMRPIKHEETKNICGKINVANYFRLVFITKQNASRWCIKLTKPAWKAIKFFSFCTSGWRISTIFSCISAMLLFTSFIWSTIKTITRSLNNTSFSRSQWQDDHRMGKKDCILKTQSKKHDYCPDTSFTLSLSTPATAKLCSLLLTWL